MVKLRPRIVAGGMLRSGTPTEWRKEYGLWVKREDKSCLPPGPPFSKTRGVYAHLAERPEQLIGVLDTFHSQAGHAVAMACWILGKTCVNYYPEYKYDPGWREPQNRSLELKAELRGLPAGRSCILYHAARKEVESEGGYMMPNALKLDESVRETAKEVAVLTPSGRPIDVVIIPSSSGTIASGVVRGFCSQLPRESLPKFIIHLGYSRSETAVRDYIIKSSGYNVGERLSIVDEGYSYKDQARAGLTPPWPCNPYYDLKAFRWWVGEERCGWGTTLLWNIG